MRFFQARPARTWLQTRHPKAAALNVLRLRETALTHSRATVNSPCVRLCAQHRNPPRDQSCTCLAFKNRLVPCVGALHAPHGLAPMVRGPNCVVCCADRGQHTTTRRGWSWVGATHGWDFYSSVRHGGGADSQKSGFAYCLRRSK